MLYNLWYLLTAVLVFSFLWAWTGVRWVRVERYTRTRRSQVGKMAEERLQVLDKACFFGCREYDKLEQAIMQYRNSKM